MRRHSPGLSAIITRMPIVTHPVRTPPAQLPAASSNAGPAASRGPAAPDRPIRPLGSWLRCRGLLALALLAALTGAPARAAQDAKSKAAAEQQLNEVHSKVQALAKQQAQTAAQRDSANAELARQANAVSGAARALHETEAALAAKQRDLAKLQAQRETLKQTLDGQRAAIAELLRATYALGRGSDLRVLLGDQDVARISRALVYSKYFQQDRLQRVQQLMGDLAKLQDLESSIASQQQALEATRTQREEQAKTLQQQRVAQQKLASQVDAQYQDQAQRLTALKQNEQALNQLLAQLQKAIDDAAREAAAKAAKAAREKPGTPPPPAGKPAGDIRGNLPWPTNGTVRNYGNGVLITAERGSEVHAVARGQVIYAGFLRGYGMLLILDHGGGWLSMYGNNESLLRGKGDQVNTGEAIGTASLVTGVNTGVYFELRQNGRPVDPRSWLSRNR